MNCKRKYPKRIWSGRELYLRDSSACKIFTKYRLGVLKPPNTRGLPCEICNERSASLEEHIILYCPVIQRERQVWLGQSKKTWKEIMGDTSGENILNIYKMHKASESKRVV